MTDPRRTEVAGADQGHDQGAGGRAARMLDTVLDRSLVLGYTRIGYALRRRLPTWPDDVAPGSLNGTGVLVTGASSGLGLETAARLADLGALVHLVVRDPDKLRRAAPGLAERGIVWACDLADQPSVDRFADAFLASGHRLGALVHNAGLMPPERTVDAAGRELSMRVHVLGPVRMTDRLLPALDDGARVVLVTSGGMYAQRLRMDDPSYSTEPYRPAVAYARSKRAQVELLPALQARWPRLEVYAMHPGWAASPGLDGSLPGFTRLTRPLLRDAEAGVDTIVWLVGTKPAPPDGGLWHDRRERPTSYLRGTRSTPSDRAALVAWVDRQLARG